MSTLGLGLSRDLVISREYGWLARQRYAAITRPVEIDAGQSLQPFRGAAVPQRLRPRWKSGVSPLSTVAYFLLACVNPLEANATVCSMLLGCICVKTAPMP